MRLMCHLGIGSWLRMGCRSASMISQPQPGASSAPLRARPSALDRQAAPWCTSTPNELCANDDLDVLWAMQALVGGSP